MGSHPLWAHYLSVAALLGLNLQWPKQFFHRWNAALAFASYFDENVYLYKDRCVLELGAGGALPSIVVAKNGARAVSKIFA